MPTNDERKQIAARLREKHGERQGTFEPQSMSIQAMNRLYDLLDCLPKRRDMFLDLADLIEPEPEPTCRMEFSERKRGVYCSHCGERMDVYTCDQYGDGTMGYSYPFCCECGAEVVD